MLVDTSGMLKAGGTSVEFSIVGALVGIAVIGFFVVGAFVSSVVQSQSSVGRLSLDALGSGDGLYVISSVLPDESSVEIDMLDDKSSSGKESEVIIDGADISCDNDSNACTEFIDLVNFSSELLGANAHSS